MRRTRRSIKNVPLVESSSDSEDDIPLKKLKPSAKTSANKSKLEQKPKNDGSSSSESDIENYLQNPDKIDFSSPFFTSQKKTETEFEKIEKNMFSGVTRLSDSSDSDAGDVKDTKPSQPESAKEETEPPEPKLNFHQLEEYTRRMEEAKKQVDKYNAKKKSKEANLDISNLLARGESKQITLDNIKEEDLHSSDFESSDDDWEEVKSKDQLESKEKPAASASKTLQITVGEMPDHCKKKKGVDLLAAMKRRLNRIRKENQIYVHKVHLLCWLAHGNFVNSTINNPQILGLALSLLPSDKSYPSDRPDLGYLEQIVQWYKKTMKLVDKPAPKEMGLLNSLQLQINRKETFDKKMYVLVFIAILRALGIQCRLVFSFQVEPLRPPAGELHSLSKEGDEKKVQGGKKATEKKTISKSDELKELAGVAKKAASTKVRERDQNPSASSSSKGKDNDKRSGNNSSKHTSSKDLKHSVYRSSGSIQKAAAKSVAGKATSAGSSRTSRSKASSDKKEPSSGVKKNSISSAGKQANKPPRSVALNSLEAKPTRSKSTSIVVKEKPTPQSRTRSKKNPSQVDGQNDSSDEPSSVPQLDGPSDDKSSKSSAKTKKPNLKKLASSERSCTAKNHPGRHKKADASDDSEDYVVPSPVRRGHPAEKPNLSRLRRSVPTAPPVRQLDVKNDIINLIKGRISEQKHVDRRKTVMKRKPQQEDSSSDSDYMPEPVKKKHHDSESDLEYFVPKVKVKKRVSVKREKPGAKIISDDSDLDESGKKKKKGVNVWVEVFLDAEEKWITADVVKGQVHCVKEIYGRATHPVSYIVAWNNDNTVKDVTLRYCKSFNTTTRKLRVDAKWWGESLEPFLGKKTARDREEDDDLNRQQLDQPMPKAVSEYKNHPLYALRRHLLKFEEIYPPDTQPLGYVRGEAVYPRNCVYVCKSREIWVKDARVVKPGEKPYKIVKARPKYDRLSNKMITDQLLEVFGPWQTTDYDPPTAENGVVPRNAFGNVELFKPCMLPKGTVHLKLSCLNKVCRKLNIDCASAIVGFDFHGGWSHPVYDGFVVCKEFEDQVVAAWEVEQEEIQRRENEKIEKRVYGNWRKLIKGLLIRERLKAKYDFKGENAAGGSKKAKGPKVIANKRKIVSDSESD